MSDVDNKEEGKITTLIKEKDPKHVEAGKRQAAISKAAKEKKMRERLQAERMSSILLSSIPTSISISNQAVGLAIGAAGIWYSVIRKLETKQENLPPSPKMEKEEPPKKKSGNVSLFD